MNGKIAVIALSFLSLQMFQAAPQEVGVNGPRSRTTYVVWLFDLLCRRYGFLLPVLCVAFAHRNGHLFRLETSEPVVVGASVLGIKYAGGVLVMTDTGNNFFDFILFGDSLY